MTGEPEVVVEHLSDIGLVFDDQNAGHDDYGGRAQSLVASL